MILPWIDEIGLVSSDPTRNILKNFPLSVKRVVVSAVVRHFHSQYQEAIAQLTTENHVEWMMEVIGQSFQLPIEDHEVINMAIDIYQKWIFNKDERPAPVNGNLQHFLREIFKHLTNIFQSRQVAKSAKEAQQQQTKPSVLKDHIFLCNRVMDIFLQMGANGEMLDEENWNHLLKLVIGVADATIRSSQGLGELVYGLLKVLFELWLCSLSDDIEMWNHLQRHAISWCKHMATIKQWNTVCLALTKRVVNLLYGDSEGSPVVKIEWKGLNPTNNPNPNVGNPVTELDLPIEYVYYAWHMMLYVIGNPNQLVDPEVHLVAFQGIQNITRQIAFIGYDPPLKKMKSIREDWRLCYAPDGDTLLDFFGPWLFEAVTRIAPAYDEGRAVAYASLCRIYCRKGGRPISKRNLSLFYHALQIGLEDNGIIILSAILLNCCNMFSYELEGSHILIPSFMATCERIMCEEGKYPELLRSACITLVSSLICMPNHYAGNENSEKNMIYIELKYQIQTIFQKALKKEKALRNLQQLLWSTCVLIYEEITTNSEIAQIFALVLIDLLRENAAKPLREYDADSFVTIYEVFSALIPLHDQIIVSNPDFARNIVDILATQVPLQTNLLITQQTKAKVIEESLYCICDLIMVAFDRIFNNKDTISKVIAAIEAALTIERKMSASEETTNIRLAGEYVLSHMLNHAGHFPPCEESTSAQITSSVNESDEVFDLISPEESEYARFFVFANLFVFCVIEQPDEKGGPGATIIVRDVTGKYCWDARLLFGDDPSAYSPLPERGKYTGSSAVGLTHHVQEHENNATLMKFANPPEVKFREGVDLFEQLIDVQEGTETTFINEYTQNELIKLDISAKPPTCEYKYSGQNKYHVSRLILSHLGFLSIACQKNFVALHSNMKLIRSLNSLDKTQPRDTHKIAIVYVADGQDDQTELFHNSDASDKFKQFIKSLSWEVPLRKHNGFMGGLDKNGSTGEIGPYYSDYRTEIMFHVPSMMPTSVKEPQQIHKKRHVGNDHVNVIWTEHSRDYFKGTIISQFNFIHIIIYPLKCGLYRVDVLVKDKNTPVFGPVCHGMILNERILGHLIRITSVNGNRIVRAMSTGYTKPYIARKKQINELVERYKTDLEIDWHYSTLFTPKAISNEVVNGSSVPANTKSLPANETLVRFSSHLHCICAVHGSRGTSTLLS